MKNSARRQAAQYFVDKLGPAFPGVISERNLRAIATLKDATGVYEFDFRTAKGAQNVMERLLNDNDAFRIGAVRITLAVQDAALPSILVKQTYPNKIIFEDEVTAVPAGTFTPDHLEAVFNSTLSYLKGNTTYIDGMELEGCRQVGDTQQSSAANKSSNWAANGELELARPFTVIGSNIGKFKIEIPEAQALKLQYSTAAHAGKKVILILDLIGAIAIGGSEIALKGAN